MNGVTWICVGDDARQKLAREKERERERERGGRGRKACEAFVREDEKKLAMRIARILLVVQLSFLF